MSRKTDKRTLDKVHRQARDEFRAIMDVVREERRQCLEDRRFYSIISAQWEGDLGEQFDNKIKLEINKIHNSVMKIINEYRSNRISVEFKPMDGSTDSDLAEVCNGLYRSDEADSGVDEAHDNAFEEACGGGFGAFRLRADYVDPEDEENDHQCILIEPIFDADMCVFFDVNAKRQDKRDADHAFILTGMTHQAFRDEYDEDPAAWPEEIRSYHGFEWATANEVYVAEYFRVEYVKERYFYYRTVDGEEIKHSEEELDEDPKIEEMLDATGAEFVRERRIRRKRIHKYVMSGAKILEDQGLIAGTEIPIVPVYGKRWYVEGVERCMGHVRLNKDIQRLKNMQMSKLAEMSGTTSTRKPIVTPEQIAGHEQQWADDSTMNYPYLMLNPIEDAQGNEVAQGPIGYLEPANVPPPMAALLQLVEEDFSDLLGNQERGEEVNPNISGTALDKIHNRIDMQSFIYMSNMSKAQRRAGEIWLGMARDVYVEKGRKMSTIGEKDEEDTVELYRPHKDKKTGKTVIENDLSRAKFKVRSNPGPTSSSRRSATLRALMDMMQIITDQETIAVLNSMAMMNMEGEGVSEARKYFRNKLLKMGVLEPTQEEEEELEEAAANEPEDANKKLMDAAATEAEAKAKKAEADAQLAIARAEESKAKAADILAGMDRADQELLLEVMNRVVSQREPAALTG
jgi:hypothetical protein